MLVMSIMLVQACSDPAGPPVPTAVAASGAVPSSATVGTAVLPSVVVTDASGRPVRGVNVTFTVTGGGTIAVTSTTTDGNGTASPGEWTLGTTVGPNTLRANVSGLTPVTFTVETVADAPANIAVVAGALSTGTVGSLIEDLPTVRVTDRYGNVVPNTQVTFEPNPGSGTITGGTQLTNADGEARATAWRLGPTVGPQTLAVRAGSAFAVLTVNVGTGAPAAIHPADNQNLSGVVGTPLATPPAVLVTDEHGNPVAGAVVEFSVATGGGTVTGSTQTTDASGSARVGSWTLGTEAGVQTLRAAIGSSITGTISATATAAAPAEMVPTGGDGQSGQPYAVLPEPATVRVFDQYGNPVPGVTVNFTVLAGGGVVVNSSTTTAADGSASSGAWLIGGAEGENTLRASVGTVAPVTFVATGVGEPLVPFEITKFAGDLTTCPVATTNCSFTVQVLFTLGLPAPEGLTVTWTGDGGATQTTTTNSKGRTTLSNLIAGSTTGSATQTARLDANGDAVVFSYQHVQAGQYNIDMRFIGSATSSQQATFLAAADRWEQVITGNLSSITFTAGDSAKAGICGVNHPAIIETIDDLLIFIEVRSIDGVGGTLGRAGPCYTRTSNGLPIVGMMELDQADLASLESNGTLLDVIVHEVGHVLGLGTLWGRKGLIVGAGGSDPYFSGSRAISGFILGGGSLLNGVPIENCLTASGTPINNCGQGTRDGHWREHVFSNELMTGYINNAGNPLSILTIGSMMDLGYQVDFGAADFYTIPGTTFGLRAAGPFTASIRLNELPAPAPRTIDDRR